MSYYASSQITFNSLRRESCTLTDEKVVFEFFLIVENNRKNVQQYRTHGRQFCESVPVYYKVGVLNTASRRMRSGIYYWRCCVRELFSRRKTTAQNKPILHFHHTTRRLVTNTPYTHTHLCEEKVIITDINIEQTKLDHACARLN